MSDYQNPHTINWFEIPVTDIGRAQKFYETVLDMKLQPMEMDSCKMAIFPGTGESPKGHALVHGSLIQVDGCEPSNKGAVIYFNAGNDLSVALARVEKAGGKIVKEKTSIGEHGYFAMFNDTEGNMQALHSPN